MGDATIEASTAAICVDFDWNAMRSTLLEKLRLVVPEGRRVLWLDFSATNNIGDILIYLGTMEWIKADKLDLQGCYSISSFDFRPLPKDVILVMNGGGNLGDLYPWHQIFREEIITRYRENRIVMLPQTVSFNEEAARRRASAAFSTHADLHLTVRDRRSLEIAAHLFPKLASLEMTPDMATLLYPLQEYFELGKIEKSERDYYLMRRDGEKSATERATIHPAAIDWFGDWADLMPTGHRATLHAMMFANRVGLSRLLGASFERLWRPTAHSAARATAERMVRAKSVVTSRLHGYMMAKLLDLPATMIDNNYGKNSSYALSWGISGAPDRSKPV